ncbi:hypothetical protein A1OW_02885 [Enterovibrio norvegicus]|uniref:Lipoprotein n=2 Tax=Enterovibrio norvegicus TaxID=188144 RepID=A0A1I5NND4_9GAMM|nr:hypothetical protein [Enterovibrio norvegicus]OEF55123.1 hypothetical protein A1OU_22320 [Enterovibrio norvegicus]OEF63548.1 hypothetical protein A1OW_02885 [Enterovibrio norvegicus]PMI28634.1 hypothetical protein BCU47_20995 [Enterovibrio norvegicus]TKF13292.1 hypothetical protein FCV66_13920 [Enterovibrio norvegicus]SFP23335.1 hypothetical protein SAMN03084138_01668 [Enterovibrio norvegicus DSM 15893]
MRIVTLFKASLVVLVTAMLSGCGEFGDFTTEQICKASIAAIKKKSPTVMTVDKVVVEAETELNIYYMSYRRPDDGGKWHVRCKVNKTRAIWSQNEGRWRDQAQDPTIRFVIDGDEITINESYPDGSAASNVTFNISYLGGKQK